MSFWKEMPRKIDPILKTLCNSLSAFPRSTLYRQRIMNNCATILKMKYSSSDFKVHFKINREKIYISQFAKERNVDCRH